jgi:ribosome-binding factor A
MPKRSYHKHQGPTQRQLRVGELVRHALSEMVLGGELYDEAIDPRSITFSEIRMSPDLKLATAYVTPLGGGDAQPFVDFLTRHKKAIRHFVAQRVDLKYVPDLRFRIDDSFDYSMRIDALLNSETVRRDLDKDDRNSSESNKND